MSKVKKEYNDNGRKSHLARNIVILVLSLILVFGGSVLIYADQLMNGINFVLPDDPSSAAPGVSAEPTQSMTGINNQNAKAGLLGGLYHDDAIKNILLLGVDDYMANDIGRADSMMLVSVDTRHQKLKLTSFMRDLYVTIPGHDVNRINTAYSSGRGGPSGAKLLVSTIEANFGTDIDRFIIIDNDAFNQIIDKLGGVTITLTQGEADLVNKYSGDSRKNLSAGTFLLGGAQAHYYSRIRAIGNDFERTERQRKVFASLAGKMKSSSIPQILGLVTAIVPLVTTNMTKNEIVDMAMNSLTLLHYPITQNRIPADNEYRAIAY